MFSKSILKQNPVATMFLSVAVLLYINEIFRTQGSTGSYNLAVTKSCMMSFLAQEEHGQV